MPRSLRFRTEDDLQEFLKRSGRDSKGRLAKLLDSNAAPPPSRGVKPGEVSDCSLKPAVAAPKPNKFNAQKVEHDGIEFDSKHEGSRYLLLKVRMAAGEILDLKCHVPLPCDVKGIHICTLILDFSYRDETGIRFEDAKGYRRGTAYALFRLKKRLAETCHSITIDEV